MEPEISHPGGGPGGMFRRILVAYDGSKEAQHALRVAVALAADLRAEVHLLLAVRPPAHAETDEERARAARDEQENLSLGLSDLRNQSQHDWEVATHVVFADDPGQAIGEHVREHGFDLVVTGAHGREQSTHRGLGRSLEALLRHQPCPVLVV